MTGVLNSLLGFVGGKKPEPTIGSSYEGGYYAGAISTAANGTADFYLVVAPKSSGEDTKKYKTTNTSDGAVATSRINGPTNTANIDDANHPAAQFCAGLTIGGFSDWYLPAYDELAVCYFNLKPTTQNNNTSSGINDYSVPKRTTNYSAGTPAQTSASDFQTGNSQAFEGGWYWSSTETPAPFTDAAQAALFTSGFGPADQSKDFEFYVRAIRRVSV